MTTFEKSLANVILAAGQGTRMKSKLAKVLHPLGGRPFVDHVVDTAWTLTGRAPVVVVGTQSDAVRAHLGDRAEFVEQAETLGTGHAAMMAAPALRDQSDLVLITYADMPLLTADTLRALVETHIAHPGNPALTMLTLIADDPRGFGRIVRREDGSVTAIVEEAVATPAQRLIKELNVGVYVFDADWLWAALERIQPTPPKNEYYLTDVVALANDDGRPVLAVVGDDPDEMIGINTRVHLAEAEAALRRRTNRAHMLNGVTIPDPASVYIEPGVQIGQDTVILPNTHLTAGTVVGEDCEIGPNSLLQNATVGDGCRVTASVIQDSTLENNVAMGPFVRVRGGALLKDGVYMGNFGEVKKSVFGPGSKMGHFSYVGDAEVGPDVNIGAGTITCNYDGVNKNKTVIGKGAFIGSDTMLVAPVEIGPGAATGAGAVVRDDVPENMVAVGVPARLIGNNRIPEMRAAKQMAKQARHDGNKG